MASNELLLSSMISWLKCLKPQTPQRFSFIEDSWKWFWRAYSASDFWWRKKHIRSQIHQKTNPEGSMNSKNWKHLPGVIVCEFAVMLRSMKLLYYMYFVCIIWLHKSTFSPFITAYRREKRFHCQLQAAKRKKCIGHVTNIRRESMLAGWEISDGNSHNFSSFCVRDSLKSQKLMKLGEHELWNKLRHWTPGF